VTKVRAKLMAGISLLAFRSVMRKTAVSFTKPHLKRYRIPTESGQSAFAAIHEIVEMLEADRKTDWSKVNVDALRQHLIDMNNMTLYARITYEPIVNGQHIHVSGKGEVRDSIQRMVMMHVAMAGDTTDWQMKAVRAPDGADVNVVAISPLGLKKMKALGLIGMMAEGVHHARHHVMLARGSM